MLKKLLVQKRSVNSDWQIINRVARCRNQFAVSGKAQPDNIHSGDKNFRRFAVRRNFHNSVSAVKTRRDIKISVSVKRQTLRSAESAIESFFVALFVNSINRVKTR